MNMHNITKLKHTFIRYYKLNSYPLALSVAEDAFIFSKMNVWFSQRVSLSEYQDPYAVFILNLES